MEGAWIVAKKADAAFGAAEWVRGVNIHFCIVEEMIELLQSADDSGSAVGSVIESSLESIGELVIVKDQIPGSERIAIFHLLLEESQEPYYEGWSDWQLALLETANHFADTERMRGDWD